MDECFVIYTFLQVNMDNNKTLNMNANISSSGEEMINQDLDFSDDEKSLVVEEGCGGSND